jgi:outer membrane receptor protein involved in Fe transport
MRKSGLLGSSALRSAAILGFAFAAASPAFAQTAPGEQDPPETLNSETELESGQDADAQGEQSIVVTGSRIRRPNLESAVPITSVTIGELSNRGEVSLGDALNDLPALRNTFSQANSTTSIGTSGLSLLDLRGLGTTRTLTLVNGRRVVSSTPGSFAVDVNNVPIELIERVDLVTGGNSAVYGSDAVAGVVNFVLRKDFDGLRVRGQSGISTYGDRSNQYVSAVYGRNFLDGRLNITIHGEYSDSDEVFYSDRPYLGAYTGPSGFITSEPTNVPNRNFNGVPNTNFFDNQGGTRPGIRFGNVSTGGYVSNQCSTLRPDQIATLTPAQLATYNSPAQVARRAAACTGFQAPAPLGQPAGNGTFLGRNYAFLPDGTLAPDIPTTDFRPNSGGVLGGLSATGLEDAMLLPGLERIGGTLLVNAELTPAFQPFLEASFTRINATQQSTQPTNISGSIVSPTFRIDNPFLSAQARQQLQILNPGATTFNLIRFNNDFGTRAERHERETMRVVAGLRGSLSERGNLNYEIALNFGRTDTYYETGGNFDVAKYNKAIDPVRNASGQIVCRVNADASTTNDDPACVPLNVFGFGAPSQAALDYVIYTSKRNQRAEQQNAVAFISGDSTGIFELPGGPIGFALGGEYRKEKARSVYDALTAAGGTFLNQFPPFTPPNSIYKEAFGELRLPLLKDLPFAEELTVEGAARYSHNNYSGGVWAYNASVIYSPVRDLRFRAGYGRSVRQPTLTNLFAAQTETFANNFTDPCDQPSAFGGNASNNITANPNRAKNCAAAGIPTTITYQDDNGVTLTLPFSNIPGGGIAGRQSGNPDLIPEKGTSITIGGVFQPRFLPGFSMSVDYFDIEVDNVIGSLAGQTVINRCYDDPGGIDNPFCKAVFRRTSADPLQNGAFLGQATRRFQGRNDVPIGRSGTGISFFQSPFNFAKLQRRGIDFEAAYRTRLGGDTTLNLRLLGTHSLRNQDYTFITDPERATNLRGVLGDPIWTGSLNANLDLGMFDLTYAALFIGRQTILSYETQFSFQGRPATNPDARPFTHYPDIVYHSLRFNFEPTKQFGFYVGVDNVLNQRPPFDLTGLEEGNPYPNMGRYFYAGASAKF